MNIIIVNCFDTYEHRVDLLSQVLVSKGHSVMVYMSNFCHFKKTTRTDKKEGFKFFEAKPYRKNLSFARLYSHSKLSKSIFNYVKQEAGSIDVLWVLVPPNSFVKDAVKIKNMYSNIKLIFDLIDMWPETMPIGRIKNIFPFSAWKNLRDKYIRKADYIVTECNLYQDRLSDILIGKKVKTLYLSRPLVDYKADLRLHDNKINLCYLGSINNIIDINVISNLISHLKEQRPVELHVVGEGERRNELIEAAEKAGADVVFHGVIYDKYEKQRIFDSCHYGLNIMKNSVCVGLTMKSIDYMEFGLPMINNIHGDTWKIIDRYKIGINTDDGIISLPTDYDIKIRKRTREFFINNLTIEKFEFELRDIIDGNGEQ